MVRVLIIGFGNLLMGDDGAGIDLIHKLDKQVLPPQVELLDGGESYFATLASVVQRRKTESTGTTREKTGNRKLCRYAAAALGRSGSNVGQSALDYILIIRQAAKKPLVAEKAVSAGILTPFHE